MPPVWHAPRTWASLEVPEGHGDHSDAGGVHADQADADRSLNWDIRDNLDLLAVARDTGSGKFAALAAAYLADLDGTNLAGLAKLASDNSWSAKVAFDGAGRVVLPVGTDKYVLDSHGDHTDGAHVDTVAKGAGSAWVEGGALHVVSEGGAEYAYTGDLVAAGSPGLPGSVWVEGDRLHYVSEADDERRVEGNTTGTHTDAAALAGSVWVESYLHWIRATSGQERDGSHADTHSDTAHSDIGHSDAHTDTSHSDISHQDSHSDTAHSDTAHSDSHSDHHTDEAGPHIDFHGDTHNDAAHSDTAHSDSHDDTGHSDISHGDTHSDAHTDLAHADSHSDQTPVLVP